MSARSRRRRARREASATIVAEFERVLSRFSDLERAGVRVREAAANLAASRARARFLRDTRRPPSRR